MSQPIFFQSNCPIWIECMLWINKSSKIKSAWVWKRRARIKANLQLISFKYRKRYFFRYFLFFWRREIFFQTRKKQVNKPNDRTRKKANKFSRNEVNERHTNTQQAIEKEIGKNTYKKKFIADVFFCLATFWNTHTNIHTHPQRAPTSSNSNLRFE